jgi:predicted RNA-binding Zn-ribbon protein involved in translation (DUF1610 family)
VLVFFDSILQWTGSFCQVTPSIFVKATIPGQTVPLADMDDILSWFQCPECGAHPLDERADHLLCPGCGKKWAFHDRIYDFREPLE